MSLHRFAFALILVAGSGCVAVKPWQRAQLATPAMALPLAESPLATSYRSKLVESRAGGGLPGTAAGGGCGCTQ